MSTNGVCCPFGATRWCARHSFAGRLATRFHRGGAPPASSRCCGSRLAGRSAGPLGHVRSMVQVRTARAARPPLCARERGSRVDRDFADRAADRIRHRCPNPIALTAKANRCACWSRTTNGAAALCSAPTGPRRAATGGCPPAGFSRRAVPSGGRVLRRGDRTVHGRSGGHQEYQFRTAAGFSGGMSFSSAGWKASRWWSRDG